MYDEQSQEQNTFSLSQALLTYLGCLFGFILLIMIWFPGILLLIAYFACGITLNRTILRKLHFHHMHNTIGDVAGTKLMGFFLWPLVYGGLLFSMVVNKIL